MGFRRESPRHLKQKAEAKHWTREMELMKGKGFQMVHWNTTFTEFYSEWVYYVKKDEVRESTFKNYKRSIEVIEQLFSNIKLRNLNVVIVQRKINEYAETLSKRTVNDLLAKIKSSLRYALAKGYIQIDFTNLLKSKGYVLENRNRALSIAEYVEFRNFLLNNLDDETNIFYYLLLVTGLRRGEALGLRPEYVLPEQILVRESISPDSDDTLLKSSSSRREIAINKEIYDILHSVPVKNGGYIFKRDFTLSKDLKKLLKQLGITETTLHGLRGTHASIAYTNLKDDVHIANRLGHASTGTTHTYYLELLPETKAHEGQELLDFLHNL